MIRVTVVRISEVRVLVVRVSVVRILETRVLVVRVSGIRVSRFTPTKDRETIGSATW